MILSMDIDEILFTIRVPYGTDQFYRIQTKWGDEGFTLSVLDKDSAYFNDVSFQQLKEFAAKYKEKYEDYYAKIRSSLIENCVDTVLYNLKNNALILSRRQGRFNHQFANFPLNPSNFSQSALTFVDELFELSIYYKNQVKHCQNEIKKAELEKDSYEKKLDNYVHEKADMEQELYSKFIMILNEKKYRLQNVRDMLENNKNGGVRGICDNDANSDEENTIKPVQNVKKRLEIISDSDASNTDVEGGENILPQLENESSNSQKIKLDFLDDDDDDLPPITALPKRVKFSKETENVAASDNLDYLEKDTIPLTEMVATTSGHKASEKEVSSKPEELVSNEKDSQDSLTFNTQDLFDRL